MTEKRDIEDIKDLLRQQVITETGTHMVRHWIVSPCVMEGVFELFSELKALRKEEVENQDMVTKLVGREIDHHKENERLRMRIVKADKEVIKLKEQIAEILLPDTIG